MNRATADRIGNVMGVIDRDIMKKSLERISALSLKINRLIEERNAIQRLINVLDEQRTRLEKPHLKGENGDKK